MNRDRRLQPSWQMIMGKTPPVNKEPVVSQHVAETETDTITGFGGLQECPDLLLFHRIGTLPPFVTSDTDPDLNVPFVLTVIGTPFWQ